MLLVVTVDRAILKTARQTLSELIEAMVMHMHHLIHEEHRPFSYLDFVRFEVNRQEFRMAHGTARNYFSRLMKENLIEFSYRSNIAFYTLRGIKFDKASRMAMTGNRTGVPCFSASVSSVSRTSLSSNPIYRIVRDLPLEKSSVHDIRLKFDSPRIYAVISRSISNNALCHDCTVNSKSLDILLPAWKMGDLLVKATIHRTDTVSVMVGCSLNPVVLDINGVIRLTNVLSVVEDRLSRLSEGSNVVKDSAVIDSINNSLKDRHRQVGIIPPHSEWIVTMWHFGADASVEYSGEKFSVTWEIAENILVRAYCKVMADKRTRIRLERQEYPRITLADAIEQKINSNQRSGS